MTTRLGALEKRLIWISLLLLAAGTLVTLGLFDPRRAVSFLAGGVLAGANLFWLYRTVNQVVFQDSRRSKHRILVGFFLRLLLIPLCLYAMIRFLFLSIPAAVAGFAVFNCSVFIEGLLEAFESNSK